MVKGVPSDAAGQGIVSSFQSGTVQCSRMWVYRTKNSPLKFFLICMIENIMQRTGIALVVKCIENKQVKKQVNSDEYQKVHRNMLT